MKRASRGRMLGGVVASLLVHSAVVAWLGAFSVLDWISTPPPPASEEDVEMVSVDETSWNKNRGPEPIDTRTPSNKKEAPPAPAKRETLPAGQIVDVAQGNDQKPADAKYLAEHDNTVAKETRAKDQTPFYGKAMPRQTALQESKAPNDQRPLGNQGTGTEEAKKAAKAQIAEREIPTAQERQKLAAMERSEDGLARSEENSRNSSGNSNRALLRPGAQNAEDGNDGKAGTPDAPKDSQAAPVVGDAVGAAPNDALQNVPTGDGTFLNTREFKYAGFFNRIKQRIGEQWKPNDAAQRRDPQGRKISSRSRVTVLDVILDEAGRVANIHVAQSCGVDFLDEEAVAAFQRAQPFPNPPSGLFDEDKHIRFRFGFQLDSTPQDQGPFFRRGRW